MRSLNGRQSCTARPCLQSTCCTLVQAVTGVTRVLLSGTLFPVCQHGASASLSAGHMLILPACLCEHFISLPTDTHSFLSSAASSPHDTARNPTLSPVPISFQYAQSELSCATAVLATGLQLMNLDVDDQEAVDVGSKSNDSTSSDSNIDSDHLDSVKFQRRHSN